MNYEAETISTIFPHIDLRLVDVDIRFANFLGYCASLSVAQFVRCRKIHCHLVDIVLQFAFIFMNLKARL